MPLSGSPPVRNPDPATKPEPAAVRSFRVLATCAVAVATLSACAEMPLRVHPGPGDASAAPHTTAHSTPNAATHTISHTVYRHMRSEGPVGPTPAVTSPAFHAAAQGTPQSRSRPGTFASPPHNASHIPTPLDHPWALGLLTMLLAWMLWLDRRARSAEPPRP